MIFIIFFHFCLVVCLYVEHCCHELLHCVAFIKLVWMHAPSILASSNLLSSPLLQNHFFLRHRLTCLSYIAHLSCDELGKYVETSDMSDTLEWTCVGHCCHEVLPCIAFISYCGCMLLQFYHMQYFLLVSYNLLSWPLLQNLFLFLCHRLTCFSYDCTLIDMCYVAYRKYKTSQLQYVGCTFGISQSLQQLQKKTKITPTTLCPLITKSGQIVNG